MFKFSAGAGCITTIKYRCNSRCGCSSSCKCYQGAQLLRDKLIRRSRWTDTKHGLKTTSAYISIVQPLRMKMKRLRTEISRTRKKGTLFTARLANAEDLSSNTAFQNVFRKMAKPARLFLQMQQQASKSNRETLHD